MSLQELFESMLGREIVGIGLNDYEDIEMCLDDGKVIAFEIDEDGDFAVRFYTESHS